MRASDDQRQRVIDELRRHCVAGRLNIDEYAARVEQALTATSVEDLERVLGDLPMLGIADPAGANRAHDDGFLAGRGPTARLAASGVVLLSVIVVLAAVLLALVLSWAWAAVLLVGWLLGLAQARLGGRRR
jgi:hypothetical protein